MAELSSKISNNKDLIWRYVSGIGGPSLVTLDKITDVLDCDIEDVVRYNHTDSIDKKVAAYRNKLEISFSHVPENLDTFLNLITEAYRKGLEDK